MSILLNDEALCCGARRLAVQLAAALPAPEDGFSPAFQADMTALTRCVTAGRRSDDGADARRRPL